MLVPVWIQAEVFDHLQVLFNRLVGRREVIPHHQPAGAGHEDQALQIAQIHGSPARHGDFLLRQDEPEAGNRLKDFQRSQGLSMAEGRPHNGVEKVHRHNMRPKFLQRKSQLAAVRASLPHAQNAARTDLDPCLLEVLDCLDPFLIGVRCADLREEPSGGLQVMVVTFQT